MFGAAGSPPMLPIVGGVHRRQGRRRVVEVAGAAQELSGRVVAAARWRSSSRSRGGCARQSADGQRVGLLAATLAQRVAAADVDRHPAAQVGQREVDPAVAAVGRAEQREQRLVLVDRQELAVALRPALGREVERASAGSRTGTGFAMSCLLVRLGRVRVVRGQVVLVPENVAGGLATAVPCGAAADLRAAYVAKAAPSVAPPA